MQQYIIVHQPWPMELPELTQLKTKIKRLENTTDTSSSISTP